MGFKARRSEQHLPEGDGSIQVSVYPAWWSCLMWSVMAEGRTGVALLKERGKKNDKSQFSNSDVKNDNKTQMRSHFGTIFAIVQQTVTREQWTIEISSKLIKGIWSMPGRTSPTCRHGTSSWYTNNQTIHVWNYFKDENIVGEPTSPQGASQRWDLRLRMCISCCVITWCNKKTKKFN